MANVAGEEHVYRRESLQGTTTVTFRSRRYHLPSVIVNQPHQIDPKTQGPHEECLLLNVGLYCPYCASKMQVSSKHQRVAVARDSEGNLIAQPMGSHPPGHPHTFQSLPYDRVQQHLQEQHRLQAAAAQGLPPHNKDMGQHQHQHHRHHHQQPSQDYDPNFYPGFSEENPSQSHYLQELRYQPQPRQTQSLPNRYLPLEYGFIEQHEGTFSFEENKRKPHQRSRLKEMHTDSLKLQKRKQRLKLADLGVHGDSAIPEVQSPTPPQTDSKPSTPEDTVVTIPVVGFENLNFDYAAAENNRRYREQQKKQQKLLQRQEQMRQQRSEMQQPYPHLQQPYVHPHLQHPQLQTAKQQHQQQQQQQQQPAQKGKQAEVFVNNYALDYETSHRHSGSVDRQEDVPAQHVIGPDGKRYFSDVNQQQQYWKQQEELMLQKENLKHQELYRKQQELLYRKQQEKLHRQQQQQHKKAHEHYRRQQQEKQGQVEPQRYNNLEKQQHKEEIITQQTDHKVDPNIALMQEYMMQQQEYARRQQQQQQQRQQQDQQGMPFHAAPTFDDIVGEKHIYHHYSYHPEQENTSEKNIQVDNLPREFFHQKPAKREREHRHKEKQHKKRHKHHRHVDRIVSTAKKEPHSSNQIREQELLTNKPPDTDRMEVQDTNITQEQPKQEHALTRDEHEKKKMEKLKREHRQNTVYYKERNTTEEQSFVRYTTARTLYDKCVKEMKGLHAIESLDFVKNQTKIASKIRRDSCRSDASSSTAPARSETSEASTDDLRQTKGGTYFANVHRKGSVDSAEPVELPPVGLEFTSVDSTKLSSDSKSNGSAELFPVNIKYDPTNQQHILSVSAEADIGDDAVSGSPGASFEEIDDSLQKYMEWLQTEETRQRQLSSGTKTVIDEVGDVMKESSSPSETEAVSEVSLRIREEGDESEESKRSSFLEPLEDVVEVEKWDSNGTTYSVYIVTRKVSEDKDEDDDSVDINSEVIAMLDHSMESVEQLELEVPDIDKKRISFSSSDIPTIQEPPGKDSDVRFYISSSSEFLEDCESRSTGSYRISEEELLDLEYRVPTILDENENSLLRSSLDAIKENTGSFLQVPPSATNIESSDGDEVEMPLDESAEEKEFEKIMSSEEMYDSTSDEDFSRDPSFDIEEEVDDILENVEVETYSPTSTLSKAFSQPRKKKKSSRMLRHIQPPDMVPILSAESNSEMTSSTSSNQEILQSLDIQTAQYQQLVSECTTTTDEDADKSENDAKDEDTDEAEDFMKDEDTDKSGKDQDGDKSAQDVEDTENADNSAKDAEDLDNVDAQVESGKAMEDDTEEEEPPLIPGISPEDAFEVVVEAASEESYGSDWPSDHDEFLPRVIKGKGKKSSDMFIYDFYHEKLSRKRTSSCECVADGASVGRLSDIGSDDLERSTNDEPAEIDHSIGRSTLEVPGTGEQIMTSSMTSSNLSDGSSLEQIIDDTMQLTERILSSCEKVDARKSLENVVTYETDEGKTPEETKDKEQQRTDEETELHHERKTSDPESNFPIGDKDAEIKELERDGKDLEEISRWSEETVKTVKENNAAEDVSKVGFSDNTEHEQDAGDDECNERQESAKDGELKATTDDAEVEMSSESEEEEEVSIEWSQDTVRKSSFDSLDTAEIIHVIDDIIEDEIYDTNEDESLTKETTSIEKQDAVPKINIRSQSPNLSDCEVLLDNCVTIVEENFYVSSMDKLEEETRLLTTKSVDHQDMFMESESKACMLDEPIYTNRQLLLPKSPLVTKESSSHDDHFEDISGSDFETKSSDFDTRSFEELERMIAMEDSSDNGEIVKHLSKENVAESARPKPLAKIVVKEVETLENATVCKVTKDERIATRQLEGARDSDLPGPLGPQKLKVLATAALKQKESAATQGRESKEVKQNEHDSATNGVNEGDERIDAAGIVSTQTVKSHPLVVRRQQGLLNRDTEFDSVTSDALSDTNEDLAGRSTPSGSIMDESDSSSISLADKPKMDYLKPGMHTFNDDSSISDLFPDTDSEPLDDEVFLSDSCCQEPEPQPRFGPQQPQTSWSELVTDQSSSVASFETPNLLSDTQAEDFLRHMLGIHEQTYHSEASDSEQAELEEDLSACLSDVCQVVTSESESEAGEVISEEVHSQEVTLVFAWPKGKKPLPSSRDIAGQPYRELHVRKVTRVKDFDVEILEGPKIVYTKKNAIEDKDGRLQENPEIKVSKPNDEFNKLDVTCESGIFSSEGDEIRQETPSDNLNLDDLLQNLSDISSELDTTGEKSVQMHDRNEAWNIHAIPLVIPKPVSTSGRQSVVSETSMKEAMEHGVSGEDALVDSTDPVHEADVKHDHASNQAIKHEDLAQHDGEKTEVDSTAVDDGDDGKTFNETRDKTDQHEDLTSKSITDIKKIEDEHEKLMYTGDDKKTHARRTVIVTAVLRPKSDLEKQKELPKDVCPLKHCDTCKSLVHVRKVAVKGKRARSHLKCMKCRQMISERLVSRVTKTSSCKNISESVEVGDYCASTWPPSRERKFRGGLCTTDTFTEHLKKHSRQTFHKVSQFDTNTEQDINTNDTEIPNVPNDKRSMNDDTIISLVAKETDKIKCVLPEPPSTEYTPLLSDTLIDEIDAQLSESHLSVESTESDATNPFYETSSSTDTVVGVSDSNNIVTFQNPHPYPQGLKSPPPAPVADSPTKIDDAQPKRTASLSKEESIDSDNLDVIIEGYGSDTEELLSEIEYELQLQIPAPVYVTKTEDSSRYISIIPVKPRTEGYGSYFAIVDFEDLTFDRVVTFLPREILHLNMPDASMFISNIPETPRAEGYGSYVAEDPTFIRVAIFLPKRVFHLNIPDTSTYLFPIDDTTFTDPVRSKVTGTMMGPAKVSSVEIKHKSAGYDTRELVCSIESPTLTFEPYEESIDLPDDMKIIYSTVTKELLIPAKEEPQHSLNGFTVNEYADDVADAIMKDTLQQLAMLYPVAKKKKKIPPVKHALDVYIEPSELYQTEQLQSIPELPDELSLLSTRCINIQLQITIALENPVLIFVDANHETGVSSQFLHYAKQYWFEFGVEYVQLGIVTNTIDTPTEAGECRWGVTAEPRYLPSAVNQILILEDYFMSEYQASRSEIAGNTSRLQLNSTNVKIETAVALPPEPAGNRHHKHEEEQNVTPDNAAEREAKDDENVAEVEEERTVQGIAVTQQREKRSSGNEIEFKAKEAAMNEAIQAVHDSKEKLNQTTAENKHKQGTVLINTRSHKSMHMKQMASGIVESAFHAARGELKVMFQEQPNTPESQTQLEEDELEMTSENLNPGIESIEWKTNRKKSEENKVWKGNPFIERDENRVWKGNPVQYTETQDRVIPVMQRRTNAPVSQSEVVTPRETANNVSVVDIGQVRTAGREDRALKSDAIAGARLVWKDYRGSNRFYNEHNVPDYQETVDKIMYPRMSQSTPELHTAEEVEELERIKQDIIKIDASGRFVLPQGGPEMSLKEPEPKKKKELSIKIPVDVVKNPTVEPTEESKTERRNQTSQVAIPDQRVVPKTAESPSSKLPDLLGGAKAFTPYGGVRTFAFGKDDVDTDTHHHKEYSKDRQYVKNSKLTTTTQNSGKHSECTFSTEGTIKDIPVFGALFGGVEDRSRPDPDHKSIQSAFDDLFGSTEQTHQTERKEIELGRNLDWYKMQEEKANVERITFKDDEAKTQAVKTLDYKVERTDETVGEVPADLGIMTASKPIHDVSIGIARKDFARSNRKMLQDSPRGIEYERPVSPLSPPQVMDVSSPSPSTRRRRGSRSPKSPRRRRRPVCPEHQRVFQDVHDGHQEEIRPKIEIVREPESQIETLIHRHEAQRRDIEPRRDVVRETEPPTETFIRGDEPQSETIIQQEPPAENFVNIPIPVYHEKITTKGHEEVISSERREGFSHDRREQDISDERMEKIMHGRKKEFKSEIKEKYLDERKEEYTSEGDQLFVEMPTDEEMFDESRTKQKSSIAVASDEDNEVRDIMEKSPSREELVEMKRQRKKKILHKKEVEEVRESEITQSRTSQEVTWKADVPFKSKKSQEVAWKSEEPDDISSTQYLFPSERNYDIVEHPKPDIHMTCEVHTEDNFEESKREMAENQKPAIEVSKKYFKTGVTAHAADTGEDGIPERQVFYDDVAGARLILKDKFGPSAFEVVRPQPSRRLAASTQDVAWRKPRDDRISNLSYQEKSLSTSSPSVYKRKEYTSESQAVEERKTFSERFIQQTMDTGGRKADVPFRRIPLIPQYEIGTDMKPESMSDRETYFRPSQQPTQRYDYSQPIGGSCKMDAAQEDVIKVDKKGRFVLPASMISNVGKVSRPTTTKDLQVPVIETSMSASSPVLNKRDFRTFRSTFEERRKSSSPVGFLKPSDIYDRETDVFQHGMSVSPSSPSFYRRNNQIQKMEEEERRTNMVPVFKASDYHVKDRDESFFTSLKDESGTGIFRQRGAKGLIKPHEILEMEKRLGVKRVTSSSEGHLPVSTQSTDDYQEASQSCSELGSLQTRPTGISFLDTMFAHRSSSATSLGSSGSTLTDTRSDRYHDVETSDDDQPRSTHGMSRSVDSFRDQPHHQPVGTSSQDRPITISSFAAESEPNISDRQRPFSARRRKPVEYVVQRQFLDDTVPYILGADVYRSDDEEKESAAFTETRRSRQTSRYSDVEKSARTATTEKKPREYVMHCRSFYDNEPFISSEDVSLNVNVNDTEEVKMKKNLTVIKKKLPQTVSTLCDGHADIRQSEEQETTKTKFYPRAMIDQTVQVMNDRETRKIFDKKLPKDDAFQYLRPKRSNKHQDRLSQSAQHIPHEGQNMHHELDKEIHDLIGLSLPSLNQLLTKQRTVRCDVEAVDVPDNTARVISVSETRTRRPPHENNLSRPIQSVRTKPVTEYIIQRDGSSASETGLTSGDVIQRFSSEQERRNIHRKTSYENTSQSTTDPMSGTDITISYVQRNNKQQRQDQKPKHSFHITDYEKWNTDKHLTATTKGVVATGKRQCTPPSDYEHVTQIPARYEGQFPVSSSPPIRRKEINVRVNEARPQPTTFKIQNTEADVSRVIQYEQELADSDDDDEEAKSDTTRKSETIATSIGSTGAASEPYPGVLPRSYLYGSQVAISESSSETSERDWDRFFKNLDEQNAQLYEVGGSTSDVSEDLDMILYSSGYLSQSPLTTKPEGSLTKRGLSVEDRRQGLTRQGAVDHSSPVPFPFDTEFKISSTEDDQDSFEKLFKKYEKEEYDNVPTVRDVEEYDNVPFSQVSPLKASGDVVEPSKEVWNLRALLAGQDIPKLTTTERSVFQRNELDSLYLKSKSKSGTTGDLIDHRSWEQPGASRGVLRDRIRQMERLNAIRGNVEDLLAEVETLQTAIRASQTRRASSVMSDLPSQRHQREGSADEPRSTRSKSWDSNVANLNATERLLQNIVASVQTVDRSSSSAGRSQMEINRELRSTQSEPRTTESPPWYDLGFESDSQEIKREKTPKSILKVKTEKPMVHSGIVRFSEDQMYSNNKKQPERTKRKQVSTMAPKTSPAGRSPPMVRRIILDGRETHL